jgi:hypothetical protein
MRPGEARLAFRATHLPGSAGEKNRLGRLVVRAEVVRDGLLDATTERVPESYRVLRGLIALGAEFAGPFGATRPRAGVYRSGRPFP